MWVKPACKSTQLLSIATLTEMLKAAEALAEDRRSQITASRDDLKRGRAEHAQRSEQLNERIDAQAVDRARETVSLKEQIADQVERLARAIKPLSLAA